MRARATKRQNQQKNTRIHTSYRNNNHISTKATRTNQKNHPSSEFISFGPPKKKIRHHFCQFYLVSILHFSVAKFEAQFFPFSPLAKWASLVFASRSIKEISESLATRTLRFAYGLRAAIRKLFICFHSHSRERLSVWVLHDFCHCYVIEVDDVLSERMGSTSRIQAHHTVCSLSLFIQNNVTVDVSSWCVLLLCFALL